MLYIYLEMIIINSVLMGGETEHLGYYCISNVFL